MPWAFHFLQPQRSHPQAGHNLNGNVKILTKSLAMSIIEYLMDQCYFLE